MTTGRKNQEYQTDKAQNPRNWPHPADTVSVNDTKDDGEDQLWHIFTDGSKSEQGVRSGVSCIYREGPHGTTHIEARQQDSSYLHGYQDNTGLNKERQKSQPPRRRNQEDSSNPEQKELENRI